MERYIFCPGADVRVSDMQTGMVLLKVADSYGERSAMLTPDQALELTGILSDVASAARKTALRHEYAERDNALGRNPA